MIKNYYAIIIVLLLTASMLFVSKWANSQNTTISSGGKITGSGGLTNYSINHVVYTTEIGINNSMPENYFVKVLDNEKEIKVFKIIKNYGGKYE